jgi:hypothetical protein
MTGKVVALYKPADLFSRTGEETHKGLPASRRTKRRRQAPTGTPAVAGRAEQLPAGINTSMMMTFWGWLGQGYELQRLFREGDEGYQAFLDQTNREFRKMIGTILQMGKFTDQRNEAEAKTLVADPNYFNYAGELLAAAGGGRARLRGQDVLDGAQDANVQLWLALLNPALYEPEGVTWESRNPFSAERGGIRGTVRSWARHKVGHFADRLGKRRTGVATYQMGQLPDPDRPFDPPARPSMSDFEWGDIKRAVINDLETQLRKEIQGKGPHWRSRAKTLRLAVEIVKRQMAIPWEWRSMPEAAADIPGLQAGLRGGLANQLRRRIDAARRRALGEATA